MAAVLKTGTPSLSTGTPAPEHYISGLKCGEAIAAGDACYIKGADGKVWLADGTALDEKAIVAGFAATPASAGEAVTLLHGVMFGYGPNLAGTACTPGIPLYLSAATPGGLATVATTGGVNPIAFVLPDGRLFAKGNY